MVHAVHRIESLGVLEGQAAPLDERIAATQCSKSIVDDFLPHKFLEVFIEREHRMGVVHFAEF